MKVLFDNNVPRGLARALSAHQVTEARELGWAELKNGLLIDAADASGFDVLITADKNIRHQQSLAGRKLAIVTLTEQRWTFVRQRLPQIAEAVDAAIPGSFTEVQIPFR